MPIVQSYDPGDFFLPPSLHAEGLLFSSTERSGRTLPKNICSPLGMTRINLILYKYHYTQLFGHKKTCLYTRLKSIFLRKNSICLLILSINLFINFCIRIDTLWYCCVRVKIEIVDSLIMMQKRNIIFEATRRERRKKRFAYLDSATECTIITI